MGPTALIRRAAVKVLRPGAKMMQKERYVEPHRQGWLHRHLPNWRCRNHLNRFSSLFRRGTYRGVSVRRRFARATKAPLIIYTYKSLDALDESGGPSIRLLKIDVDDSGRTRFALLHTKLQDAPPYDTLSYVWGTSRRKVLMPLSDGRMLRITKTLDVALPRIIPHCKTGYIWIDQLCIDQENLQERSQQVAIMGQIYSRCSSVLVWPGQYEDLHPSFAHACRHAFLISKPRVLTDGDAKEWIQQMYDPSKSTLTPVTLAKACQLVLQATWFERAWVFQEVVIPQRSTFIICSRANGKFVEANVSLQNLYDIILAFHHLLDEQGRDEVLHITSNTRWNIVADMVKRRSERHDEPSSAEIPFEQVLSLNSSRAKTTHKLDRLYAYFGLNQSPSVVLNPSYEVHPIDALISTTQSIITGTRKLDILEIAPRMMTSRYSRPSTYASLPSWAPNFFYHQLSPPYGPSFRREHYSYTMYPWSGTCDRHILRAHGRIIDRFERAIGPLVPHTATAPDVYGLYAQTLEVWRSGNGYFSQRPQPTMAELLHILLADGHAYDRPADPTRYTHNVTGITDAFSATYASGQNPQFRHVRETVDEFLSIIIGIMNNRILCITSSGLFAFATERQAGYEICVLHGCTNPVVVQRLEDGYWYVLGTCYLEGWMDPWSSGRVTWGEDEGMEFLFV